MRNYIKELTRAGHTARELSGETGLSASALSRYKTGAKVLKSGTKAYETIRNANRRIGYREARKAGLSSERASARRRVIFDPDIEAADFKSTRVIGHKEDTTRFQMRLIGEFYNYKTKKTRIQQGFSHARLTIDKKVFQSEAIADAQAKLGGSNWQLQRIIETEIIEYRLTEAE
ncbi:MAG: hypothetical protein CMI54_02240 [Parcubacteria group bacterium]|nr:hypothetical protein [Parcubacteria group bacterium]